MIATVAACLVALLGLGLAERIARDRAWRAVPIRVHVNGSRGKSTVTRLIWSALREAGIPALAKTTGTAPRLLLPDGSERPIARHGPPSIREQLALLRQARRLRARAVVVECMALDPELQWVSEHRMVAASLGVITNVRRDHAEIMGSDPDAIAATLANTVPAGGVLVCGDERHLPLFRSRAARLGTRVVSAAAPGARLPAAPSAREREWPRWLEEDAAIALAATRELGLDDGTARRGFERAPRDPGAMSSGVVDTGAGRLHWLDATAANDPDSLALLLQRARPDATDSRPGSRRVLVYNHRFDRGPRLVSFAAHSAVVSEADLVIVTGARPPWTAWQALRRARGPRGTVYVAPRTLPGRLREEPANTELIFCGNTRGLDVPAVLREVSADG